VTSFARPAPGGAYRGTNWVAVMARWDDALTLGTVWVPNVKSVVEVPAALPSSLP